jgi:chemotaxis-related protein WspB
MLCLMFYGGANRYAIAAREVIEVLPYASLEIWPGSPACVAGMFLYRGQPTAAVDLLRLAGGESCPLLWNARLIVVRRAPSAGTAEGSDGEYVGLLVNRISTCELPDADMETAGQIASWGWLRHDAQGLYQRLDLARLIPAAFGGASDGDAPDAEQRRTA